MSYKDDLIALNEHLGQTLRAGNITKPEYFNLQNIADQIIAEARKEYGDKPIPWDSFLDSWLQRNQGRY